MKIARPGSGPKEFEGIANCYVGRLDGAQVYPPSELLSQRDYPPVELIIESTPKESANATFELSADSVREAVSIATEHYKQNVGILGIEERFQEYLTRDIGLTLAQAIELFKIHGIAPFLLLKRIFISQPLTAICLDFICHGEEYLDEYEFSLDQIQDRVEFVTPRGLMPEGSYPASRNI
jgi:hypothetical protein